MLITEQYQEVRPFMITTYERGKIEGRQEGRVEGLRESALLLLEAKFRPLPPEVRQRVAALSAEQLNQLLLDFTKYHTLKELRLED